MWKITFRLSQCTYVITIHQRCARALRAFRSCRLETGQYSSRVTH